MLNLIASLILGAGLDSLYYYLYLSKIKEIRTKKLLFYVLIFIGYVLLNMIIRYNLYYYLAFDIFIYFILKFLYKSQINDFFLVIVIDIYSLILSISCYYMFSNYIVALLLNKSLMFIPLIAINGIKKIYKFGCSMWNRNRDKSMPVKSLTLRNICLTLFNIFILINYIVLLILI